MKVAYLFTSFRGEVVEKFKRGEDHGNGFWGMFELPHYGVDAWYVEPEHIYSKKISLWIRKHLGVYWLHLSVFKKLLSYDFVFTSTAFGTQLVHTLLHIKKPGWVMHDFSILGLVGEEKTLKQKMFGYLVRHCAGIVTLAEKEKQKLEERFPNLKGNIAYIPFGTNTKLFAPSGIPATLEIFTPGRDPDRDYKTLFAAASKLETPVPVVVTTHASRLAKFDPLPSFVVSKNLSLKEYIAEYDHASVVVVPLDTHSGLNNAMGSSVLFEAMSMGKAIIATATETMQTHIIDGENGLLVEEGNVEAMRAALARLLNDEALRENLGKNARTYALAHLDSEKMAERLAEFFKKLKKERDPNFS
jgi:glycosyltransferase involved in cell wall biosynthesis